MTLKLGPKDISQAASLLLAGHLVAFPTETVYGLGAPLFARDAILKIYQAKGRPSDNPLIVHVNSIESACELAQDIPDSFFLLAKAFWPGALTVVLRKRECVPDIVSGGGDTVAIRMPSHPVALNLIAACKQPLVAPSANLSGRPSSTTAAHVLNDFEGKIGAVIDGGSCQQGIESTVVSLLSGKVTLLRPGLITKEALEKVLGYSVDCAEQGNGPTLSPGMKYRHYAPKAAVHLFTSSEDLDAFQKSSAIKCKVIVPQAASFYADLRQADDENVAAILVHLDASIKQQPALLNRLERSAEKKV